MSARPARLTATGAALVLAACTTDPAAPRDPASLPFMGSWDCGVTVMTFMPDAYLPSNESEPVAVTAIAPLRAGSWQLTLADGARMAVQNVTDRAMTWFSFASGDSFDCTRVAG